MKLLAIETATEACSVAMWCDGEVHERFELAPRRHAEFVLPWADELLAHAGVAKSQLDAIAVGRGPGAFTGVRLAIAMAQGIALALDRPTLPVSSLAALAMRGSNLRPADSERARTDPPAPAPRPDILASIDARMGEIYLGAFALTDEGLVEPVDPECLARPTQAIIPADRNWIGVGTGFAAEAGALVRLLGPSLTCVDASALPHATDIARLAAHAFALGGTVAAEHLEPAYLRDKVALTLIEQRAARSAS